MLHVLLRQRASRYTERQARRNSVWAGYGNFPDAYPFIQRPFLLTGYRLSKAPCLQWVRRTTSALTLFGLISYHFLHTDEFFDPLFGLAAKKPVRLRIATQGIRHCGSTGPTTAAPAASIRSGLSANRVPAAAVRSRPAGHRACGPDCMRRPRPARSYRSESPRRRSRP